MKLLSTMAKLLTTHWNSLLQIMEISTSNKFPYHGSVQKVGSIMEICWKSQ